VPRGKDKKWSAFEKGILAVSMRCSSGESSKTAKKRRENKPREKERRADRRRDVITTEVQPEKHIEKG